MAFRLLLLLPALLPAFPAAAQEVVTSSAPDSVAVTIYRAPNRSPGTDMDLGWLEGYALVTEKRTVQIPAGRAVIRFEGVAGGMLPESAMVSGLPDGVTEKNLDADLLSPGNLYARSLGRPVVLRRTHARTGEVHEERAVIRSGPEGSVILQTRAGFETGNCGATQDELVYGEVPPGLTPRPTLSVETTSQAPARVTIALSYLAWGFDWQANYVLKMAKDGKTANMFAWVTLANSDTTSFADAETAVVGGEVNREDAERNSARGQSLAFRCYFSPVDEPPPLNIASASADENSEIVVTAMRAAPAPPPPPPPVRVQEEGLGDLRLYRVPMPTTVASMAQKQVAMFELPKVQLTAHYVAEIWPRRGGRVEVVRHFRMRNLEKDGLGRALPAGQAVVFEPFEGSPILSGEGILNDAAVGQNVDVAIGDAPQVTATMEILGSGDGQANSQSDWQDYQLTARNANPWPVQFEARLRHDTGSRIEKLTVKARSRSIESLAALTTWRVTIPANSAATLGWRQSRITPP